MNENEGNAFRVVYAFCSKWRDTVIETQEQWSQLAEDVGEICRSNENNPLLWKLLMAVMDYFTDLYRDGTKPMPAGYLGRDDL